MNYLVLYNNKLYLDFYYNSADYAVNSWGKIWFFLQLGDLVRCVHWHWPFGRCCYCFWPLWLAKWQLATAAALALLNYARHGGTSGPKALPAVHCCRSRGGNGCWILSRIQRSWSSMAVRLSSCFLSYCIGNRPAAKHRSRSWSRSTRWSRNWSWCWCWSTITNESSRGALWLLFLLACDKAVPAKIPLIPYVIFRFSSPAHWPKWNPWLA